MADIDVMLDIALHECGERPREDALWQDWPWWFLMMQRLRAAASGVEFSWLRRHSPPGRELTAEAFAELLPA